MLSSKSLQTIGRAVGAAFASWASAYYGADLRAAFGSTKAGLLILIAVGALFVLLEAGLSHLLAHPRVQSVLDGKAFFDGKWIDRVTEGGACIGGSSFEVKTDKDGIHIINGRSWAPDGDEFGQWNADGLRCSGNRITYFYSGREDRDPPAEETGIGYYVFSGSKAALINNISI